MTKSSSHSRRILIACSSDNWGGTEKWALRAGQELQKRGWRVTFALRNPDLFLPHTSDPLTHIKLPFKNDADINTMTALTNLARSYHIVISTRVRDYWLAGISARIAHKPHIVRLGVVRRLRDNYIMDRLRYCSLAQALLVNADQIKSTLLKTRWMHSVPIEVIYNGVDAPGKMSDEARLSVRQQFNIPDNALLIVGAGRLSVEKRWDWLVKSAAQLDSEGFSLFVLILGEGSERSIIEAQIANSNADKYIRLLGYQPNITSIIGSADIAALPSNNEGVANFCLEAMGLGVPVVLTDSGGVKERFTSGKELLIADTDNFDQFSNMLRSLASDSKLRQSIGEIGYQRVKSDFSWENMTEKLEGFLLTFMPEDQ